MDGFLTEPIVLSGSQSVEFINFLRNPGSEYLNRRNEIFDEMDANISIQRKGRDMEVDIPDLDLSFIDEKSQACSGIELHMEVSVVVNSDSADLGHFYKIDEECSKIVNSDSGVLMKIGADIKRKTLEYNDIGRDTPGASVKDKKDQSMIDAYKTEQLADAA